MATQLLNADAEVLANLKMNLTHADEKLTATHFYRKVVQKPREKGLTHIVRFTSVPPEMDSYFQALIKYAVR